jgi:hypothetical protein
MHRAGLHRWAPPVALGFAVLAVVSAPLSLWLYLVNRTHVTGVDYL